MNFYQTVKDIRQRKRERRWKRIERVREQKEDLKARVRKRLCKSPTFVALMPEKCGCKLEKVRRRIGSQTFIEKEWRCDTTNRDD